MAVLSFWKSWKTAVPLFGILVGCNVPHPTEIELDFELADDSVAYKARFTDLRLNSTDPVLRFRMVGGISRQALASKALPLPWIRSVKRYEVRPDERRLNLDVSGTIDREVFEKCLKQGCDGTQQKVKGCDMFPLRRCKGQYSACTDPRTYRFVGSGSDAPECVSLKLEDGQLRYRVRLAETKKWPHDSLPTFKAFLAKKNSAQALDWLQRHDKAVGAGDATSLLRLEDAADTFPAPFRELLKTTVHRERLNLLYHLLYRQDPSHLEAPESSGRLVLLNDPVQEHLPPHKLPERLHWQLRSAYEVIRRAPSAMPELVGNVCRDRWMRTRADYRKVCTMLGQRWF